MGAQLKNFNVIIDEFSNLYGSECVPLHLNYISLNQIF